MKFAEFKPGKSTVYSIRVTDDNNKPLNPPQVSKIYVLELHPQGKTVLASVNGKPARTYTKEQYKTWMAQLPPQIEPSKRNRVAR